MSSLLILVVGFTLLVATGLYDIWRRELACFSDFPPFVGGSIVFVVSCITWYDTYVPMLAAVADLSGLPEGSFSQVMVAVMMCVAAFCLPLYFGFVSAPKLIVGVPDGSNWACEESLRGFIAFCMRRVKDSKQLGYARPQAVRYFR